MERIIIVHWNRNTGPEPIIQYPPKESFPPKDLYVKLWTIHELNKEKTSLEFVPEGDNWYISVSQQYAGELYLLVIGYSQDTDLENIIDFDILSTLAGNLIKLINTNKITSSIFETFNTIRDYSKLDKEENLMTYFQDKIKGTILKILQNGVLSKLDLNRILTKEYGFSTSNIDLLLATFVRDDLMIKKTIPRNQECYFLIKDISIMQVPPKKKPQFPDDQEDDDHLRIYKEKLISFYSNFETVPEIENKPIINLLINNREVYALLKSLRKKLLSVNECVTILNNDEDLFYEVLESDLIFEHKGMVYLLSDYRFAKFTPFYLIDKITQRYKKQDLSLDQYLTHVKLLTKDISEDSLPLEYEII